MKEEIWYDKLNDKLGFYPNRQTDVKTKSEQTEGQYKNKRCVCGIHSISGHKQKWKYPKWKKKSRKLQELQK